MIGDGRGLGGYVKSLGGRKYCVAMTGPGFLLVGRSGEDAVVAFYAEIRAAVLPYLYRPDFSAEHERHELHPVADTQNRHTEVEERRVYARCAVLVDAVWAAGEDYSFRFTGGDLLDGRVVGN